MGEGPDSTPSRPNRFPDAGGYPDERDRRANPSRQIDCSVANAERASGEKPARKSTHTARAAQRVKPDESDHDH